MNAIKKLWQSLHNLAGALDRLAGLAHAAGDTLEDRLPPVQAPAPSAIEGAAEPGKNGRRPLPRRASFGKTMKSATRD